MRALGFQLSDVTEEPAVREAIRVVEEARPPKSLYETPKSLYETDPIYGGFYSRGQVRVTRPPSCEPVEMSRRPYIHVKFTLASFARRLRRSAALAPS